MSDLSFRGLAMDANDVRSLVSFWCDAVGYQVVEADYPYVAVIQNDAQSQPRIIILQVPEGKSAKNRVHIEFDASDLKSSAERLTALGASILAEREWGDTRWIVMQDPEGNEFCLVNHQNSDG